jgi:hypothetical protein
MGTSKEQAALAYQFNAVTPIYREVTDTYLVDCEPYKSGKRAAAFSGGKASRRIWKSRVHGVKQIHSLSTTRILPGQRCLCFISTPEKESDGKPDKRNADA